MVISQAADKPAAASNYPGGDSMDGVPAARSSLRLRQIPPLRESEVPALHWRTRDGWSGFVTRSTGSSSACRTRTASCASRSARAAASSWKLPATPSPRQGVYATFEFEEQIVGWPRFTIDAPKGTVVEVMTQESHDPNGPPWLDTHFFSWTRFICREGVNQFENFDYESLRWLQLHVRNASQPVEIRGVGVRRRMAAWPYKPEIHCSERPLARLFDAAVNTLYNSAEETCADGMGRERSSTAATAGTNSWRFANWESRGSPLASCEPSARGSRPKAISSTAGRLTIGLLG